MRRISLYILKIMFLVGVVFSVSANEITAVWSRLYKSARIMEAKYSIMQSIVEQHDKNMVPVLTDALDELIVDIQNMNTSTEWDIHNKLAGIILRELGSQRAGGAAYLVMRSVEVERNPYIIATAIMSLGKIGDKKYTSSLAEILRKINLHKTKTTGDEIIAYGCVNALERLKDPAGFRMVFLASLSGYSPQRKVRKTARKALVSMIEDPTEVLLDILKHDSSFPEKFAAIEVENASRASRENKISLFIESLRLGLLYRKTDVVEKAKVNKVIIKSVQLLKKYRAGQREIVPMLKQIIKENYDPNTTLSAIETLGTNRTDEAAALLMDLYLLQMKKLEDGGIINRSKFMTTIIAMGNSGNKIMIIPLKSIISSRLAASGAKQAAREALKKINQ